MPRTVTTSNWPRHSQRTRLAIDINHSPSKKDLNPWIQNIHHIHIILYVRTTGLTWEYSQMDHMALRRGSYLDFQCALMLPETTQSFQICRSLISFDTG